MKKAFILIVSLALILGLMPIINNNVGLAASDVWIELTRFGNTQTIEPKDLSFKDNNFLILDVKQGDTESSNISAYDSDDKNISAVKSINLDGVEALHLATYKELYFYATYDEVYYYISDILWNVKIDQSFENITDLVSSYKNLFLIDSLSDTTTKVYQFNENTNRFDEYKNYDKEIFNFCYNEVSKNNFSYDGQDIYIEDVLLATVPNVTEILCDFAGNLFVFQDDGITNKIYKYTYVSDYKDEDKETFILEFEPGTTPPVTVISAAIIQETGNFAVLIKYDAGGTVYRLYVAKNLPGELNAVTANTAPDVDFCDVKIFDLNSVLDYNIAKITGYPSNRLYTVDPLNYNDVIISKISEEERYIGRNVLVLEKSEKFSLIIFFNAQTWKYMPAIVYNNSLTDVPDISPDFNDGKIMQSNTKVYKYPSNFNTKSESAVFSFQIDSLNKNTEVTVMHKVQMEDAVFAYIKYGGNKYGYVNAAEILDSDFNIVLENPFYGFVDCNGEINLYERADTTSAVVVKLKNRQEFEIISSGPDFYSIKVEVDGKFHIGFIQTKYVLESGLTNMEKLGLYIGISVIALLVIALGIRYFIKSSRKKN